MDTGNLLQLICVLMSAGWTSAWSFEEFNRRLYPRGDLLDLGENIFPEDTGKGFIITNKTKTFRFKPTKYFETPYLPDEFSIAAVFVPKVSTAFLFALLAPDSVTIRMGLSLNKTGKSMYEIYFYYNDDVTKHAGYQKPVIRAVVPDLMDKPDQMEWKVGVYVNRTKFSVYLECSNGFTPDKVVTVSRKSMNNSTPFYENGSTMFVLSGGPIYNSKFVGSIKELKLYKGNLGVRQRCADMSSYPADDIDAASGLQENKNVGNVFKQMTTIPTTPKPTTTMKPTTKIPGKSLRSVDTKRPVKVTEEPLSRNPPAAPGGQRRPPRERGCAGDFEDKNLEDVHKPPCRKNFMKTSTTRAPTTLMPTTPAPRVCKCKGIKGDRGPPGPPGKKCISKKKEAGGEWMLLPQTTMKPRPASKGVKGDKGVQGMKGDRGAPGLPCRPPPGGKVVMKGGKVKFVEGEKEWPLLDTTTAPPRPTGAPRLMKGEKGTKGDQGKPGLPCKPPPGGMVVMKDGRPKIVEGKNEWDLLNTTESAPGPPGPRGPPGPPGVKGVRGMDGKPGVCPVCNVTASASEPGLRGEKGEPGVCAKPCEPGRAGRPGPRGLKGEKGDASKADIDKRKLEDMVREVVLRPTLRTYFRGEKGESGSCGGGKPGVGCPIDGGCVNNCNRGPPGRRGPPGVGLDKLESFGYGAVVFKDLQNFEPVAHYFPAGSMVYVERTEDGLPRMFIKTNDERNTWREMVANLGALRQIEKPRTTRKPVPPTPQSITGRKIIHNQNKLYLIALDDQQRGNLGDKSGNGHAMAEHQCETNARNVGLQGDFGVVLGHEYLQLRSLVAKRERTRTPIVNLRGEVLYNSWEDFLTGARMNPDTALLTFSGKDVLRDTLGMKKRVWLGTDRSGETRFSKTPTCRLWTSSQTRKYGLAGDLSAGQLLNVKPIPCSENAFVLCVRTTTRILVHRRRK